MGYFRPMKHILLLSTVCIFCVFTTNSWGQSDVLYPETSSPGAPEDQVFQTVDTPPSWPKCAEFPTVSEQQQCTKIELAQHLGAAIEFPATSENSPVSGTVYVKFVVGLSGELEDIEVIRGVSDSFDRAALHAVEQLPALVPGSQNGKVVRVEYVVPVRFTN